MDTIEDLRAVIAQRRKQARDLYDKLPTYLVGEAQRRGRQEVHPFLVLGREHPEVKELLAFANLLAEISQLEALLGDLQAVERPPNLKLVKQRRSS